MGKISLGVYLNNEGFTYPEIRKIAQKSEELGFKYLVMPDHFYPMRLPLIEPVLEAWVTIASLLRDTSKLMIGPLVTCAAYRYPSVLAKMAATVDHISEGRLSFGIGACWYKEEFDAYGIPFRSARERMEMLREAIIILRKMWSEEKATFAGKYFKVDNAVCLPKPYQRPLPIMVGSGGEKYGLRVVAELADKWNWFGSPEEYSNKIDKIAKYCDEFSRNCNEITFTWTGVAAIADNEKEKEKLAKQFMNPKWDKKIDDVLSKSLIGLKEEVLEKIDRYKELGVKEIFIRYTEKDPTSLEKIAKNILQ